MSILGEVENLSPFNDVKSQFQRTVAQLEKVKADREKFYNELNQ